MAQNGDRLAAAAEVIATALAMTPAGINRGKSGNVSRRFGDGYLITPTGIDYDLLQPQDIVLIDKLGRWDKAGREPSSEWRMHHDIYAARADAGAIVHAHPVYATALACLRQGIPAFHYMVAAAGGRDIRCSDYALFGTQALSDTMLRALEGRRACILANHGIIAYGRDLRKALALAVEVETLAEQYAVACQLGEPVLLSDAEMDDALNRFQTYGHQPEMRKGS